MRAAQSYFAKRPIWTLPSFLAVVAGAPVTVMDGTAAVVVSCG
jgi:hypothetical protein